MDIHWIDLIINLDIIFTRYMDKRLSLQLNGNRKVTGVLRGFDPFMNIVLDETVEEISATEKHNIGMVVRTFFISLMLFLKQIFNLENI